jgi:GNAT superfamily N-acetyltransferase
MRMKDFRHCRQGGKIAPFLFLGGTILSGVVNDNADAMSTIVLQLTRMLYARPEVKLPQGVAIRTFAGEADIERWLEIRHRAFARQRVGVSSWTADDFRREFLAKSWWRPGHLWLAETFSHRGEPSNSIATVALAFRGSGTTSRPVVHWLAVLPNWRRRGIGRALMATLEARCWELGYRQVWLETHNGWQAAVEMYRHLGYEPAPESLGQ